MAALVAALAVSGGFIFNEVIWATVKSHDAKFEDVQRDRARIEVLESEVRNLQSEIGRLRDK